MIQDFNCSCFTVTIMAIKHFAVLWGQAEAVRSHGYVNKVSFKKKTEFKICTLTMKP